MTFIILFVFLLSNIASLCIFVTFIFCHTGLENLDSYMAVYRILYVMNATLYYDSAYPANSAYVYGFDIYCHHLQHCSLHRKLFQKSLKLLCKIFRLNVLMWDMYISYKWSLLLPLKNIWWIWNTNVLQIKCSGGF